MEQICRPHRLPNRISNKGTESERGYSDKNSTRGKGSEWPPGGLLPGVVITRTLTAGRQMGILVSSELPKEGHDPMTFFLSSHPSIYSNKSIQVHKRSERARDKEKPQIKLKGTAVPAEAGTRAPDPPSESSCPGFRKAFWGLLRLGEKR